MGDFSSTPACSLRFIGVSIDDVKFVVDSLPQAAYETRAYRKDKSKLVVVIDLTQDVDCDALSQRMRAIPQDIDYDIFVSVTSELDSEIIDVPERVVELLRKTKSRLTFSFTVI